MVLLDVRVLGSIQALGFRILVVGFWILGFGFSGRWEQLTEEGRNPTNAQSLSILQCPLLFRRPFPRPLGFSGFLAAGDRLGFRIFGFGLWVLGFGFWVSDLGFGLWVLDFGIWFLGL